MRDREKGGQSGQEREGGVSKRGTEKRERGGTERAGERARASKGGRVGQRERERQGALGRVGAGHAGDVLVVAWDRQRWGDQALHLASPLGHRLPAP